MENDQYSVPWHCSFQTYFRCFRLAPANMRPWPLMPFFQISLTKSELKTTHNTFRDCGVHFCDNLFEIAVNNISSFFHCACIVYRVIEPLKSYESTQLKSQNDRPSHEIPHESRANLRVPAWVCDVEVAKFVLKIAQLAISMDPRGNRACDLRLRLWLLVQKIYCVSTQIISTAVDDRLVRITRRFQITQEAWKNDSVKVSGQRGS